MHTRKVVGLLVVAAIAVMLPAVFGAEKGAPQKSTETTVGSRSWGGPGCDIFCAINELSAFTGSWEGVLTPEEGGPPPFRILFTFGGEGTVVVSDAGPPTPHLNTAEHGAWERTGRYEFTIIYKQFLFNATGDLDATFKGRVKFTLDPAKMEISGPVKVDIYLPDGTNVLSGAGTMKCTKIRVEPLD